MRFGSVCSGIEAVSVAWRPLGFEPAWYSEIEPYCCELIDQRHGCAPNLGNMETLLDGRSIPDIDVLVGGTPCQSFSVAGLRGGLDDARGNLALVFCELARRLRPRWVVWENVPGVLSNDDGRGFGSIVGALHECGYGVCWRVLNAQYFGVPQRRRRVFVVGYLGDWRRSAAVLFEPESLRGHPTARPGPRENVAGALTASAGKRRGSGQQPETLVASTGSLDDVAPTLAAAALEKQGNGDMPMVIPPISTNPSGGKDSLQMVVSAEGSENLPSLTVSNLEKQIHNQAPLVFKPSHFTRDKDGPPSSDVAPPLTADADKGDQDPVVFQSRYARNGRGAPDSVVPSLTAEPGKSGKGDAAPLVFDPTQITHPENRTRDLHTAPALAESAHAPVTAYNVWPESGQGSRLRAAETDVAAPQTTESEAGKTERGTRVVQAAGIRRLTPLECERLQGFPDHYTAIEWNGKPASDTARYRALGNSMAVPVMSWLGRRIRFVDQLQGETE